MKHLNCLFLFCAAVFISSCSIKSEELGVIAKDSRSGSIPLETALETLNDFLSSHESEMPQTKSGSPRRISSIDIYPPSYSATKSVDRDSTGQNPVAYIVNFEDNDGFAVLGANDKLPGIIAVTEGGYIDPATLKVYNKAPTRLSDIGGESSDGDDWSGDNLDSQYYCEEDGDYYSAMASGADDNPIVNGLIRNGTFEPPIEYGDDTGYPEKFAKCSPLVNLKWHQDAPYNKYCKRGIGGKEPAAVGCSNLALAMIVTANEFPNQLTINNVPLSYPEMKCYPKIGNLSDSGRENVTLLIGYSYNNVLKLTGKNYTMVTPEQIRKRLIALGYTNVIKHKNKTFDSGWVKCISNMLADGKPVFMSAIPKSIKHAHSWVVDGATYKKENNLEGEYLLHFNFGWGGKSNGYFSINCLNPAKGVIYDKNSTENYTKDYLYVWHFRLLTYDIPAENISKSVTF